MSEEEDDYLSDKFLVDASSSSGAATNTTSAPKTYAERRKEALKRSALKNEQNRVKSLRERERAAREEALGRSLFERAQEEARASGRENKALAMMMKMGFRPGQALGREEEERAERERVEREMERGNAVGGGSGEREGEEDGRASAERDEESDAGPSRVGIGARRRDDADGEDEKPRTGLGHRKVPLAINEWEGKKGIGLGKRARSPTAPERLAKMAKMAEERDHLSFRDRARQEYEERRAVGRLAPAQRTCATLDEKAGIQFNVLWLNPEHPETFPDGLLDALDDPALVSSIQRHRPDHSLEGRLRAKMHADALRPLKSSLDDIDGDADADKAEARASPYSEEDLEEARQFLRLNPRDRLTLVLDYLRRKYAYCFWCGTQYDDHEDMEKNCPGPDEDAHD